MVLKKYRTECKPEEGDFKIVKRFAYLPKKVGERLIWLQNYKQIFMWEVKDRHVFLGSKCFKLHCGNWDLKQEKC